MNFPPNLDQICDLLANDWPQYWFKNFGSGTFFHVCGFREYMWKNRGFPNPSNVADLLILHKDEIFSANPDFINDPDFTDAKGAFNEKSLGTKEFKSRYFQDDVFVGELKSLVPIEWLANLNKSDVQDIDYLSCLIEDRFYNLTPRNIQDAYAGKPITFAAAILVYLAAKLYSGQCDIQIRFAGFRVLHFETIYPELTTSQKNQLCEETDQIQFGGGQVFEQMALGRPVTRPLANRTVEFLNKLYPGRFPTQSVKPLMLRTDIPTKIKKSAADERTYFRF